MSQTSTLKSPKNLVWLRRDLRWDDHAAMAHASQLGEAFVVAFVFDREILDQLANKADRRVEFIWEAVSALKNHLISLGGDLIIRYGSASEMIPELVSQLKVKRVICAKDYEPAALTRDQKVEQLLSSLSCQFIQVKDHVIFEGTDVIEKVRQEPGGVFFLTLHLGSGDLGAAVVSRRVKPSTIISKRFTNQFLDIGLINIKRSKAGTQLL